MFGTISESEMRRRTENVGLSVQSVRLEGGDVTRAFMRDAGEYARGASAAPSFFPAPVAVTDWSDDGACLRSLPDSGNERAAEPCGRHGRGCAGGCGERSLLRPRRHSERESPTCGGDAGTASPHTPVPLPGRVRLGGEIRTIDMGKGEGLPFQPLELFSIGVHYSEGCFAVTIFSKTSVMKNS